MGIEGVPDSLDLVETEGIPQADGFVLGNSDDLLLIVIYEDVEDLCCFVTFYSVDDAKSVGIN